jgi:CBS domain-containing protein
MTRDVACAHEDSSYKELVKLLASRRVSALPVVDSRGHVLGVLSEADLLPKQEQPGRPVGIVSRADLLMSFLRPDEELRREIVEGVVRDVDGWATTSTTCHAHARWSDDLPI